MAAQYGAHEVMELHEVLTDTVDGINQFELYRPYAKDPQLQSIMDRHIQFMVQEYNNLVNALNQQAMATGGTGYRTPRTAAGMSPTYGLNNPAPQTPNTSPNEMNDQDVASGMLGCHKSSATMRMVATQEIANPQLRRMVQQCAVNSSEMAYETFQYMNQKGYYQVPTMKDMTTNTVISTYQPAQMPMATQQQQAQQPYQ
ncbi:spore coat protein [Brevibacillus humidisoli]|uniref:spore coat protein n=1 Tax=Brevibacillus humidisoli TaxID=2895522 RepID=UPI001E3356B7|nr:spore coat protein [Brevibacillus humidisoli]UFJ41651.1 spore coat protein [Brevibacillus humidisoli]